MDLGHHAFVKTAFAAVDLGAHHLVGQCAIDEHHLAVITVRYTLRLQIQRVHTQLAIWQRRFDCGHGSIAQRLRRYFMGSTGRPRSRISKCSFTRSLSELPISAIFWPFLTLWSSFTKMLWLWA